MRVTPSRAPDRSGQAPVAHPRPGDRRRAGHRGAVRADRGGRSGVRADRAGRSGVQPERLRPALHPQADQDRGAARRTRCTAADPCGDACAARAPTRSRRARSATRCPWGLRLVDGTCNNLVAGKVTLGAADQDFPRLVPKSLTAAEDGDPDGPGPRRTAPHQLRADLRHRLRQPAPRHQQPDRRPDRATTRRPSTAAGRASPRRRRPARSSSRTSRPTSACRRPTTPGSRCSASSSTTASTWSNKGGSGTVFMPLQPDDPLYVPGSTDELHGAHPGDARPATTEAEQPDLAVRRPEPDLHLAPVAPGLPARVRADAAGRPVRRPAALLTGPGGGMATWADVKAQAATCSAST